MSYFELFTLIGLIAGPAVGAFLAEHLAKNKSKNERRHAIFRALLASKAGPIHGRMEALNILPYEFHGHKEVIATWRRYLAATEQKSTDIEVQKAIGKSITDAFDELLFSIVKALKIGIEQRDILQGTYNPIGVTNRIEEDDKIRQSFMNFLTGAHPVLVKIMDRDNK